MFRKMRFQNATARLFEEKLFEIALNEAESGKKRQGLWSKAISDSDGDMEKAKGIYLKLRVQSLKDEILVSQTMEDWLEGSREPKQPTKKETMTAILCNGCGASESIALTDIRKAKELEHFVARKVFLYDLISYKCRSCSRITKIDYQGREWA